VKFIFTPPFAFLWGCDLVRPRLLTDFVTKSLTAFVSAARLRGFFSFNFLSKFATTFNLTHTLLSARQL
jgi:hypothetical protein